MLPQEHYAVEAVFVARSTPLLGVARRARTQAQIVDDKKHQTFFAVYFDPCLHASQHALVLGVLEHNKLILETALEAFSRGLFRLVGHVLFGAAHSPDLSLGRGPEVLEIDVSLIQDDNSTGGNIRTGLACPPVVVGDSGIHNGKGEKKAVRVEPAMDFGGGLASAVYGSVDGVGDQFHHSGIDGANPDLETLQEALVFFARGKARLDILKVLENRPKKRFDEVSLAYLVCFRKSFPRVGYNLESAQSRCLEPKAVADVAATDGMRKLGKKHGSQMPQDADGTSIRVHPSFTGGLIEDAFRYQVEKLLEHDHVGAGWFLVHTPIECYRSFHQPNFFPYHAIPVGKL